MGDQKDMVSTLSKGEMELLGFAKVDPGSIINVQSGFNRLVLITRQGNVIKIKLMPFNDAFRHLRRIYFYYERLREIGISVPSQMDLEFRMNLNGNDEGGVDIKSKNVVLVEQSKFLGKEVGATIRNPENSVKNIFALVEMTLDQIFRPLLIAPASSKGVLDTGLDPLARNVVLDPDGEHVYYVDLFPAKITTGHHKHLEYPEPKDKQARWLGIFRHYWKQGVLYVFFVDLCRMRPDLRSDFRRLIRGFIESDSRLKDQNLLEYFDESPADRLFDVGIDDCDLDFSSILTGRDVGYFYMRELACVLSAFHPDGVDKDLVRLFFHKSHFQSDSLPDKTVRRLINVLVGLAKNLKTRRINPLEAFKEAKSALEEI